MAYPSYPFSEFVDRVLVWLYEKERSLQKATEFINLEDIKSDFIERPPDKWIFDAANVLRSMGWAEVYINSMSVSAQLTGQGRLYVERDSKTRDISTRRDQYFNIHINNYGNNNVTAVGPATQTVTHGADHSLATRIVDEMRESVRKSQIAQPTRDEALTDLDYVEREMKKPEPNRNILAAVLHRLSDITSIAGNVATLIQVING